MKIEYSLTRWDILRWNLYATVRQRPLQVLIVAAMVFFWWTSFGFEENQTLSLGYRIYLATFAAVFGLMMIVALTLVMAIVSVFGRKHSGVMGKHSLEVLVEGLREVTPVNETLQAWKGIYAVRRTKMYGFIFINESMAHIVPFGPGRVQGDPEALFRTIREMMKMAAE